MAFDLIVRGGTIADGKGAALFEADIGVRDGRIAEIGSLTGSATEEIDARGKLVAPRLRRHPFPLRRPGAVGPAHDVVELARRHHHGDG
jgi:hypothetical protein